MKTSRINPDWEAVLTLEERDKLAEAWDAKQHWIALNKERAAITKRAIRRARSAANPPHPLTPKDTES